jgi:hypothetical protein
MRTSEADVQAILRRVAATIGGKRNWINWPGGWKGDIESALIDAVFSARAVYYSKYGRGILANVMAWQSARRRKSFNLKSLSKEIDAVGVTRWAAAFGNSQNSPRRLASAPNGRSKAAAVREAASALMAVGISRAEDVDKDSADTAKHALMGVGGIGFATANYFLMLLGAPGVKPDRMIHRFLRDATGHPFSNPNAVGVTTEVAIRLKAQPHDLDHAIWSYESKRTRG